MENLGIKKSRGESLNDKCGQAGTFKFSPLYTTIKEFRPLFPDLCSCFESLNPIDQINQTLLPLVDILENYSNLEIKNSLSIYQKITVWSCTQYLKRLRSSIIFHPGQFEFISRCLGSIESDTSVHILIPEPAVETILSICVALIIAGFASIQIQVSTEKLNLSRVEEILLSQLGVSVIKDNDLGAKDEGLGEYGGRKIIISELSSSNMHHMVSENKDVLIIQAAESWNQEQLRIDFSQPFSLQYFLKNTRSDDPVSSLWKHIQYTRLLEKADLVECVAFIKKYPSLLPQEEPGYMQRIHQLREIVWREGGDLSFSGETESILEDTWRRDLTTVDTSILEKYFIIESVLAVSILSLLPGPLRLYGGRSGVNLRRACILERAEFILNLIKFQNPCECMNTRLNEGIQRFERRELISTVQENGGDITNANRARHIAEDFDSDSDEESGYFEDVQVNIRTSMDCILLLEDVVNISRTEIAYLYLSSLKLTELLPTGSLRFNDYIRIVLEYLSGLHEQNILENIDLNLEQATRSVQALVTGGVLVEEILRGEVWILLRERYASFQEISSYTSLVSRYMI
ncbi:uncharacterized protein LOC111715155 isoform X2 [Eurytemora carolleeae]|uniref:uncharacterized protein LOC111715155 isoform X2 n=1 Tax=Eurytemora carolleeae TaxID=1294199 RepID=UPI000C76CFCD|nr:uncharacterized protein LOC111715155 isoform X2 [Eurytemora carolleeae]|eukprot:XP_023346191.1 uncharacterized protein LOC111715155 isoform X2 [Eurytemora affinis]